MARSRPDAITVAVTGAAGYIATRLITKLLADETIGRVVGFDVVAPAVRDEKFVFDEIDVRNDALAERLTGIDVLVHLAFIMDPIRDEAKMRDVNVNGSQNVFRCAGKAGVKRLIYTSSAVVYGAHPDNDMPLTEESPLRANLDFNYAAHKLEVEYIVKEVAEQFPDLGFTIFRPAIVFGPHVDNAWSHLMEMPILPKVQGHDPVFQFVHEEDVADALHFGVVNGLSGPFNIGAEGSLTFDQVLEALGRRSVDLPEPIAFSLSDRMWKMGLAEAPAGMLHYVMYPWVVSSAKLEEAGFRLRHGNEEIFRAAASRAREHVRLGRRAVKRADLVKGAAAGAGLLGGLVTLRALRRRSVAQGR